MGFIKRFLSLGKKGKKQKRDGGGVVNDPGLTMDFRYRPPASDADADSEAVANKLLRSASARYAVVADTDCNLLPPLPHPIDQVIGTPTGSSASLRSSSYSKGSYKVTVHQKEHYTSTTTCAYGSSDQEDMLTPKPRRRQNEQDTSAVIRLRSDPSVASLLDMYDSHGCLPDEAFSNSSPSPPATPSRSREPSPTRDGRAQARRNGSTLRQLLGSPSTRKGDELSAFEGDISWAERFLGETPSQCICSSTLSFALPTPDMPHDVNVTLQPDTSFSSDYDRSAGALEVHTISSMDVEMSTTMDTAPAPAVQFPVQNSPMEPVTPQRPAIEVFDFLASKRRSRAPEETDFHRALPEPPSAFSSPSECSSVTDIPASRFSTDTSFDASSASSHACAMPTPQDTPDPIADIFTAHRFSKQQDPQFPTTMPLFRDEEELNLRTSTDQSVEQDQRKVKVIFTNPQTVMVTAPTPNHYMDRYESRIPRGPRSLRKSQSKERRSSRGYSGLDRPQKPSGHSPSTSSPKDHFTAIPTRPRKMQPRRVSSSSSLKISSIKGRRSHVDKENGQVFGLSNGLSAKRELPFTPVRGASGRKALLRAAVTPGVFMQPDDNVPSPASSTELSPVGQKIMMDARKQRFGPRQRHA